MTLIGFYYIIIDIELLSVAPIGVELFRLDRIQSKALFRGNYDKMKEKEIFNADTD